VAVLDFGFAMVEGLLANEGRPGFVLDVRARARLLDGTRETVLDEMTRLRRSDARSAADWLTGAAEGVRAVIDKSVEETARDIVREFFRLYYPPNRPLAQGRIVPNWVLQPIDPLPAAPKAFRLGDIFASGQKASERMEEGRFAGLDTLQPVFRWESFPRGVDLDEAGGSAARFTDVSYEISVFEVARKWQERVGPFGTYAAPTYIAGKRIYERTGLSTPEHRIEEPLAPCGRYAWTVRARFRLDGQPRVTVWTVTKGFGRETEDLPLRLQRRLSVERAARVGRESEDFYFLFRVPSAERAASCD
jgi:hypothetical protein